MGWLGTALGTVGVILALSTAPVTWSHHHHAVYVLLQFMAVVCLVILVVLPLRHGPGWVRFQWIVWRAARMPPVGLYDVRVIPQSPTSRRDFSLITDREPRRLIWALGRPAGLRITAPVEVSVWANSLPFRVHRYGKTIFRVEEFLPTGFVIAEQSPGLRVKGELYYSDLPRFPQQPPGDTVGGVTDCLGGHFTVIAASMRPVQRPCVAPLSDCS